MQPVSINITVQSRDIPRLVCSDYSQAEADETYNALIAEAVAKTLGIEDFLFQEDRINELRRLLWEQSNAASVPLVLQPAD